MFSQKMYLQKKDKHKKLMLICFLQIIITRPETGQMSGINKVF